MKPLLQGPARPHARVRLGSLPWPAPAVLAWAGGMTTWTAAAGLGATPAVAWWLGVLCAAGVALSCPTAWRRSIAAAGFPLASLALGAGAAGTSLPAWTWAAAAGVLVLLYPVGAWRDAPWFPTPAGALDGLAQACGAQPPAEVLDAGCGLGHGLAELQRQFPAARCHGIERSRVLRWAAAWRCPWAQVRGGDIWAAPWAAYQLVYVFQRPESMARAYRKAMAELPEGGWLASLEFEVPGMAAQQRLGAAGERPVWLYRKCSTRAALCR